MSPAFVLASTILQVLGYAAIAYKLSATGLARRYRYLTGFVVFECVRVLIAGFIERGSDLYGYFYFITQPAGWLLHALMTLEVFTLVFQAHQGIAVMSRVVIVAALTLSVAGASLTLTLRQSDSPYRILETFLVIERAVNFSLLGFVLALALFLSWYPVPLNRNSLAHTAIFTFFFGAGAIGLLIRTVVGPAAFVPVNYGVLAASLASIFLWLTAITPEGERAVVRTGYHRDKIEQERLLAQMEAINRTLLRSARE